ncbi:hypothetical protein QI155_00605 [Thermodesulfovibrio sp. 1176]|nr:hypothetical protein [Thermodesulfovibrio sp. 1176]
MRKKLILFAIILFFAVANVLYSTESGIIPKTLLILPETSKVKIKWILLPEKRPPPEVTQKIRFIIDNKNEPMLLYGTNLILNPIKNYLVKTKESLKDIICLENGVLIFSDSKNLGYLELEKNINDTLPIAKLKAVAKLPQSDSRVFKGSDSLYSLSYNPKTNKYEIYLFKPLNKNFEKILSLKEKIDSLSGKGEHLFISSGKQIKEYKNGKFHIVYEHPRQDIKEIFYSEKTGLFYKTENGIGFVKDGSAMEFLQSENFEVFFKGSSIYVLFLKAMAVVELENIDDLKNYSFKIERVIDIDRTF